ncbi:MAG: exodeoxyribonuclease VII large subunit [Pirellulales bacterium]|nr:exodeoxyribonuclease VII large subunit [Pirellulales bacterium]
MDAASTTVTEDALTVSQLTDQIQDLLESSLPSVWITGEISNFARPQSGHCYFTLKDEKAQIRAVIWRGTAERLRFDMHDGLEVVCHGGIDVYPPRGSYQLVIDQLHPKGIGALELRLRQLRAKLAAEGLFDEDRKRPLPRFPRRVAFVTSPTGAAIRDFLEVLRRRWRGADVLVIPAAVQGANAAGEIVAGIEQASRLADEIDVLVVGRGGGSLEDLWSFNEENVVRAVRASRIPVVSAVGHEIDVTLSDLAADVRALTPSEAAELVVPAADEIRAALAAYQRQMSNKVTSRTAALRSQLDALANRRALARPEERVRELARRVDEWAVRFGRARDAITPRARERVAAIASRLETLSPLAVVNRGYSVSESQQSGRVIRSVDEVQIGDGIRTRLVDGVLHSRVERVDRRPIEKTTQPSGESDV